MVISTIDPKPANTAVSLAERRKERRLNSQAIVSKNTNQFSVSVLLLAGVLPHCGVRSIQMSLIIRVSASEGCLSYEGVYLTGVFANIGIPITEMSSLKDV